jgi:hypothetical protein
MKIKTGDDKYIDLHQLMAEQKASDLYLTF